MSELVLRDLTARQLQILGDAALLEGHPLMARSFYQALLRLEPTSVSAHSRFGLTLRANQGTQNLLEVLRTLEAGPNGPQIYVGVGLATFQKTPPFIYDAKFMRLAYSDNELAPLGHQNWHWVLLMLLRAAQQAKNIPGDFVELGVYKGQTPKFIADYLEFSGWDKHWWLYDTFEGVPDDQNDAGRKLTAEVYGAPFSFEEVRDRFAPYGNFTVTKGRVPEVLEEVCPEKIAFLHIDLNSSVAEVGALNALYDRISPGGLIILDDYCWASSAAQYIAETAWFADRGLTVFPLPTGQGLFIKPPA
jgi:hypothetical protein